MKILLITFLSLPLLIYASDNSMCKTAITPVLTSDGQLDYVSLEPCLSKIKSVIFEDQTLQKLPEKLFEKMPALIHINVINCKVITLNDNFFGLTNQSKLTTLRFTNNNISSIDATAFSKVKGLKHLNLTKNEITTLKDGTFNDLAHLETIDLSDNQMSSFSMDLLKNSKNLETVVLHHNFITEFTVPTVNNKVKQLDLQFNRLTSVPTDLEKLKSLSVLLLSHNTIELTTTSFSKLSDTLTQLYVSEISVSKLANPFSVFANLPNLNALSYCKNGLDKLDVATLPKLTKLIHLMLYDNQFTDIDFTDIRSKFPQLKKIGLSQVKPYQCTTVKKMLEQLKLVGISHFFYIIKLKTFGIGNNIENIGCENDSNDVNKALQAIITKLQEKIGSLETQVNQLKEKTEKGGEVNEKIEQLSAQIKKQATLTDSIKEKAVLFETHLLEVEGKVQKAENSVATIGTAAKEAENVATQVVAQQQALETYKAENDKSVNAVKVMLKENQKEFNEKTSTLQGQLSAQIKKQATLTDGIKELIETHLLEVEGKIKNAEYLMTAAKQVENVATQVVAQQQALETYKAENVKSVNAVKAMLEENQKEFNKETKHLQHLIDNPSCSTFKKCKSTFDS